MPCARPWACRMVQIERRRSERRFESTLSATGQAVLRALGCREIPISGQQDGADRPPWLNCLISSPRFDFGFKRLIFIRAKAEQPTTLISSGAARNPPSQVAPEGAGSPPSVGLHESSVGVTTKSMS